MKYHEVEWMAVATNGKVAEGRHYANTAKMNHLTLPTMGPLEQPQILGGGAQCTPPIRYACSTCAILMKLSEIKQLDI